MIRNRTTNDWFMAYKKRRGRANDEEKCWTDRQDRGSIWSSRNGPIQAINSNKLKGKVDIVEFELIELVRDPK